VVSWEIGANTIPAGALDELMRPVVHGEVLLRNDDTSMTLQGLSSGTPNPATEPGGAYGRCFLVAPLTG
jgi:hypothetical protein